MAYDFLLGCLGIYVFCPMGFAHDMWWGTYVKCMLCPCIFMFVLRSCSPFGWTAGRISILSIFRRRSPSPSMVRKAFVHYYRPTTFHYDIYITTRRRPISTRYGTRYPGTRYGKSFYRYRLLYESVHVVSYTAQSYQYYNLQYGIRDETILLLSIVVP